jgi:hypothetical protein
LRGNLSVIQALVQHKADINAKDIDGNTPCHFCSEYGHRYCLKFLLTKNPYLFANNNEDKSAIDVAISGDILTVSNFIILNFCRNSKTSSLNRKRLTKRRKRRCKELLRVPCQWMAQAMRIVAVAPTLSVMEEIQIIQDFQLTQESSIKLLKFKNRWKIRKGVKIAMLR